MRAGTAPAPARAGSAPERILHAAARRLVSGGASRLNMHDLAEDAGVSKGLIHYHFRDKDTLLARLVEWLAAESTARERAALDQATPRSAVDALWSWLEGELVRGHIRVLLELAGHGGSIVQDAARHAAAERRAAAAATVERLFRILQLTPRVPAALLGDVHVAFVDGLALETALSGEPPRRVVFDVLWLSLLSLAE